MHILHTPRSDTIFIQTYMDLPPGVPGVSKNQIFLLLSSCAKIDPKKQQLRKSVKIEKKMSKKPVFLHLFEYSAI